MFVEARASVLGEMEKESVVEISSQVQSQKPNLSFSQKTVFKFMNLTEEKVQHQLILVKLHFSVTVVWASLSAAKLGCSVHECV